MKMLPSPAHLRNLTSHVIIGPAVKGDSSFNSIVLVEAIFLMQMIKSIPHFLLAEAPWLSISPCEGYTPSSVTVSKDKGGVPDYGVYTTAITATSTLTNCVNCSQVITVTVTYTQCWRSYLPMLFKKS
jgi:hypothetical protein